MNDLKQKFVATALAVAMALTAVACSSEEEPPNTTPPGDSTTTAPVGS